MHDIPVQHEKPKIHYEYTVDPRQQAGATKARAYQLMDQLDGWCSKNKAAILIDIILKMQPEVIVEIGVWGGKSLIPMAYALQVNQKGIIYGIDPWESFESIQWMENEVNMNFWSRVDHMAIMMGLMNRINQFNLGDQVQLIKDTSMGADPIEGIDILHVDGNHSDVTSFQDVQKWVPLLKKGGIIVFDDIGWNENGMDTTARAVSWLNDHCTKLAEFEDSSRWGLWINQ